MLSNDQLNSHRSSQDATRKKSNWKIVILKVHFRHAKPISWQNSPRVPYQDVKMVEREKYSKWDRARNRNNWNSLTAKIVCACHWRIPMMPNCISSSLCFFFFVLRVFFIFFLDQSLCLFVRFVCDSMRSKSKEMRKKTEQIVNVVSSYSFICPRFLSFDRTIFYSVFLYLKCFDPLAGRSASNRESCVWMCVRAFFYRQFLSLAHKYVTKMLDDEIKYWRTR